MIDKSETVKLIQCHKALEVFDYNLAVNWAIELLQEGKKSDNKSSNNEE